MSSFKYLWTFSSKYKVAFLFFLCQMASLSNRKRLEKKEPWLLYKLGEGIAQKRAESLLSGPLRDAGCPGWACRRDDSQSPIRSSEV